MPYRQQGSPNWYISYTNAVGQRVKGSSGTADFKEAKALEAKKRHETHRERQWGDKPARTYDELSVAYIKATKHTKKSHERDLTSFRALTPFFAGRVINDLGPQDFADYKTYRTSQRVAHTDRYVTLATVAKEIRLLSAAINYANHEWDWGLPNIAKGRAPKERRQKLRWLTQDESRKLIDAALNLQRAPHLHDFIELGLATGMRRDEMLCLEWSRVDFAHRKIYFDSADQKSGTIGAVPLNNWAVEVLRRRLGWRESKCPKSLWVFSHSDGSQLQSVKKAFWAAAEAAGMPDVTPHTLRHTFASWLVQAGVPLATVRELCRHKDIRTTMIYAHLAPDQALAGISVLDRLNTASAVERKTHLGGI